MRRQRIVMMILAVISATLLSACASIPTSSPVGRIDGGSQSGGGDDSRAPEGPAPGASIEDIVRGFLAAGTGTGNNFAVARSYLTGAEAQEWNPLESVSVMPGSTDIESLNYYEVTSDQKTLAISAPVVGLVDASGIFNSTKPDTSSNLEFELRQQNGEWRISSAPNGLLISQSTFPTMFLNYSLQFYTSDYSYLVPDSRWFLRSSSTPTAVMNELLSGPAPYLSGSVVTAIPDGAQLSESRVVTIDNGVAQVALTEEDPAPTDKEKGQIRHQVVSTLKVIPSISNVQMSIGGQSVPESLQPKTNSSAQVDGPPVVLADNRLSRISGTTVARVENSPDLSKARASDPAVSFDDSVYAYLSDGGEHLMRLKSNANAPVLLRSGDKLVGPSIDRFNLTWTAETANKGEIIAIGDDDKEYKVDADFLARRTLMDLEVSKDGTRLALLSRSGNQPPRIDVVGLPRDNAGNPVNGLIGRPIEVGSAFTDVRDISWAGSTSLVALASMDTSGTQPFRIPVTGPPEQLGKLPGGDRIAAGEDDGTVLVTSSDGEIYSYNAQAWQKLIDIAASDPSFPG